MSLLRVTSLRRDTKPPPSYQAPPSYQQPAPGYQQPGQPAFGAPAGPNTAPPAGLGYAAPARNTFGLHFNNVAQRFRDTTGVPQQLTISYWLWVAAAALGVLASFINIFTMRDVFGEMMVGAGIVGLIFSLVFAALYVFIAIRLKEGSRWARLVLTILGAFAVISLLRPGGYPQPQLHRIGSSRRGRRPDVASGVPEAFRLTTPQNHG